MNLDREKAKDLLNDIWADSRAMRFTIDEWVDRLEGCVVEDPRIAAIAALFDDDTAHVGTLRGSIDGARGERVYSESTLRAVLGGGPA